MPVLPFILMNLSEDSMQNDQTKFEDSSKIIFEMQESFVLFLSPTHDFKKVGLQYDKLMGEGLFDVVLGHIKRYADVTNRRIVDKARMDGKKITQDPLLKDLVS